MLAVKVDSANKHILYSIFTVLLNFLDYSFARETYLGHDFESVNSAVCVDEADSMYQKDSRFFTPLTLTFDIDFEFDLRTCEFEKLLIFARQLVVIFATEMFLFQKMRIIKLVSESEFTKF